VSLQLRCKGARLAQIATLRRLVAAAQQDDQGFAPAGGIEPVSGPVIDAKFDQPVEHLYIAEQATLDARNPVGDAPLCLPVAKPMPPLAKSLSLPDFYHMSLIRDS